MHQARFTELQNVTDDKILPNQASFGKMYTTYIWDLCVQSSLFDRVGNICSPNVLFVDNFFQFRCQNYCNFGASLGVKFGLKVLLHVHIDISGPCRMIRACMWFRKELVLEFEQTKDRVSMKATLPKYVPHITAIDFQGCKDALNWTSNWILAAKRSQNTTSKSGVNFALGALKQKLWALYWNCLGLMSLR